MSYPNNMNFERISEEALGDVIPCATNEFETLFQLGFYDLFDDPSLFDLSIAGTCDDNKLMESISNPAEPNEFDSYLGPNISEQHTADHDNSLALINSWPVPTIRKEKPKKSHAKQIPLSMSVGVGLPQKRAETLGKISVHHPLEECFRPRYKSDYLTQTGKIRKPRYVTDRLGNHCVTIKMAPRACGVIRVDWLTIQAESGDLYSMPYRFQQPNGPDCNPMYVPVQADQSGMVKLYLVLIKSKQDELKSLQPLKPFHPLKDAFGIPDKKNMENITILNPKQLIQKYQLDKSQLAFTFCAFTSDKTSCIPEWDTTVYSTTLTEMPPEASKQKTIACPKCRHIFPLPTNGADDDYSVQETGMNKRQPKNYIDEEPMQTIKKPKFMDYS